MRLTKNLALYRPHGRKPTGPPERKDIELSQEMERRCWHSISMEMAEGERRRRRRRELQRNIERVKKDAANRERF